MKDTIVIVGAGQAGIKAAETLRGKGHNGTIVMIGDEPWLPYQRPPLSKAYLKGELDEERMFLTAGQWMETSGIDLRTGRHVTALDPGGRTVALDDGDSLTYDKLLIATGSRARSLPLPGALLEGVHTLRDIKDAKRISGTLSRGGRAAVIGGGFIGMEFAAVARAMGKTVTVIEAQERVLQRVVAAEISAYLRGLHEGHGVRVRTGTAISGIEGDTRAEAVVLDSGERIAADLVLIAAGAVPAVEIAQSAGLVVERGIVVDAECRTSDPSIFAAGDCTVFRSERYGRMIGLESVQNACDQARAAAAAMLGEPTSYDPVPWFWSDQYDTKLQIAGLSAGFDCTEVIGDPTTGKFSIRYFLGSRLLAVDSVNDARSHMLARREIAAQPAAMAA
ncbi:MAG: NAD(P)/FAD-dependent oxidoreductase [Hyphomicrobiaceae bacterium]